MLRDHDRRVLADIEHHLAVQDPEFARRMSATTAEDRPFPTVLAMSTTLYISLPLVGLLFGWIAAVLVFDLFAIVIAAVLIRRRRLGGPPRGSRSSSPTRRT
jgi:hypothetical protein